ncbi:MAG: hypothetical protein WBD07_00580 [Vicinamibacterales bacterium]
MASRTYAPWLWLLAAAFLVRVLAQPMALVVGTRFLLPFDAWYSGVVPYSVLLATQLLILGWLTLTARRFAVGTVAPRRRLGVVTLVFAVVYFAAMLIRLLLGATILGDRRWFASPLPTIFHLVLATFLFLYGHFHLRHGQEARDG